MNRRFSAALVDISPLRESPAYRALWLGQMVSLLGSNMRLVAVAWHVYALTGSTVMVGLVGLAEVVPLIAVSIFGGALVDTRDRKKLIVRAQLGLMLSSGGLAGITLAGEPSVGWIYLLTGIASAFNAIDRPARSALLPHVIAADKLTAAMALRQVLFQTTTIVGPAIGGLLIEVVSVGWVYALDAASFSAALIALRWVPVMPVAAAAGPTRFAAVKEGLAFAARTPVLMSIFVIDLVAMIFGMPRAVFPALAKETFGMGAGGVGILYAAPAVGALVGALTTGWVSSVKRQGLAVIVAVVVWGTAIALTGLSLFSLALTLTFLAIAGAADVVSAVFRGTILLQKTPDALRGRLNALNIMVVTGGPRLGDVEAGLVAGALGAPASVVIGGIACVAGAGLVARLFPSLRAYVSPVGAEPVSG
ncbi:MAG TPA: MFS transporter [Actinomycetota bacterium]|nr:MFS transporter [Actinomycetota bacterium]